MVAKYRKKPVVIEALQVKWGMSLSKIIEFVGLNNLTQIENGDVFIKTLEGNMRVSANDYIIKGIHGEFYPCKPDIFKEIYELVEE